MKIRKGFVSNSSSTSFTLGSRSVLTKNILKDALLRCLPKQTLKKELENTTPYIKGKLFSKIATLQCSNNVYDSLINLITNFLFDRAYSLDEENLWVYGNFVITFPESCYSEAYKNDTSLLKQNSYKQFRNNYISYYGDAESDITKPVEYFICYLKIEYLDDDFYFYKDDDF